MRISKSFREDQDNIKKFIDTLGGASVEVRNNKRAKPEFFLLAHEFIVDYVHDGFFKKEEVLVKVLEDGGFPPNQGPIAAVRADHKKSLESSDALLSRVKQWQAGDERVRIEVAWASSECASALRQHLNRLKTLIFPLIEQTVSITEEDKISDQINNMVFKGRHGDGTERYMKIIDQLEDELGDWK